VKVTKRVRLKDLGLELSLLPGKIGSAAQSSLSLQHMVTAARSFCPVDTGALSASVRNEVRGHYEAALVAGGAQYINLGTMRPVDYAGVVHEGTSRMPARPFLLQAVLQERLRFAHDLFRGTEAAL
jgi:hypothetical protein